MVISFGFENRPPHLRPMKIFDVRDLSHDTKSPEFQAKQQEISDWVNEHPYEHCAIGCKKGQHRSVVLARNVAKATRQTHIRK